MAKLGREATKRRGRAPKEVHVKATMNILKNGNGIILLNNKGMTLSQVTGLRAMLRKNDVKLRVVKNTLLALAMERVGIDPKPLKHLLQEETVIAVGKDPVLPAKLLMEFVKNTDKLQVKGAFVDGQVLGPDGVETLSKLPGREELLSRMLGSLMSPIQKLVFALNDGVARPVRAIDAIRRQKEESAAPAA